MQNFNIGLLGHVDSGKTTLAKALSTVSSTASFDKNPQSQERGITLDLGFSSAIIITPERIKRECPEINQIQLTFVDCPGHAGLIRTIIGGAQIVDLIILVIDAQRGIQTQTAECIVTAELLRRKLIVAVNKIDLLTENAKTQMEKMDSKLRKTFGNTAFGADVPIVHISGQNGSNVGDLLDTIQNEIFVPSRNLDLPALIYVDHCFSIKGHGTICTGTIVQGKIVVGDTIEIPQIKEQRKIKSIQVFRQPVDKAIMGDRVGICVNQFNSKLLERGLLAQPNYLKPIFAVCVRINRISYYKFPIKHKDKFHITVGHETVMGSIILFRHSEAKNSTAFNCDLEYDFVDEINKESNEIYAIFALVEFEKAIYAAPTANLIASKLDMDLQSNCCRLAFWGHIQWSTHSNQYQLNELPKFKIIKRKTKQGLIQRLVTNEEIIVQDLFKKETNPNIYLGKSVQLSTGECGIIDSKFGKVSKIKVKIVNGLKENTIETLKNGKLNDIQVILRYKKYLFNKDKGLVQ